MPIVVDCPCGKRLRTADEHAGKRARCPSCGAILPVPELDDQEYRLASPPEPVTAPAPRSYARPVRMRFDPIGGDSEPASRPETSGRSRPGLEPETEGQPDWGEDRFDPEGGGRTRSVHDFAYWVLVLAFLPLTFSLLVGRDDIEERLRRTMQAHGQNSGALDRITKAELFARLPGGRIEGALLTHGSAAHWIFAGMSISAFFVLLLLLFPKEDTRPGHLLSVGLFTATLGILFLLIVQFAADHVGGVRVHGKAAIVWLVLLFIGFSYRAALDPSNGFLLSALGFTFGVGLCEELCKALPLLWIYSRSRAMNWRRACLWGLASGVGFGVSEGIMYSSDKYNGLSTGSIYLVRFLSCVALHAVWGASVGMALDGSKERFRGHVDTLPYLGNVLRVIAVPMVLHGLYDTLLKKEMNSLALGIAFLSFAWFAWQVEMLRGQEASESGRGAWA